MNPVFASHSGLRFLVLLVGLIAALWFLFALVTRRPTDKSVRILGSSFVGLLDLQILLGLGTLVVRPWYPQLIGHLVLMLVAAVETHVLLVVNRKRAQPGFLLPFLAVAVALVLIVAGIAAIGRGPFTMTAG